LLPPRREPTVAKTGPEGGWWPSSPQHPALGSLPRCSRLPWGLNPDLLEGKQQLKPFGSILLPTVIPLIFSPLDYLGASLARQR